MNKAMPRPPLAKSAALLMLALFLAGILACSWFLLQARQKIALQERQLATQGEEIAFYRVILRDIHKYERDARGKSAIAPLSEKPLAPENTLPLHVRSVKDAGERRIGLIRYIFKSDALDRNRMPDLVAPPEKWPFSQTIAVPGALDLTVAMKHGISSRTIFIPHRGVDASCLLFYHQGHESSVYKQVPSETALIDKTLDLGCDVVVAAMPLLAQNNQPKINIPGIGEVVVDNHNILAFLETEDFCPISYFMEPVLASLNWALVQRPYKVVAMAGLSGGGWTTALYSAMDDRIAYSADVAGSAPIYLRANNPKNWGDWEQTHPRLYGIASYLDIYVLDTFPGRHHLQANNELDGCCYGGPIPYAGLISDAASGLGGHYEAMLSRQNPGKHLIPAVTRMRILRELHNRTHGSPVEE